VIMDLNISVINSLNGRPNSTSHCYLYSLASPLRMPTLSDSIARRDMSGWICIFSKQ